MSDLAFDEAVRHALDELDLVDDLETELAGVRIHDQALALMAIGIGRALVYATLAVAEAIAAASEDAIGDVVDERLDRALTETFDIAAELAEADTAEIEVAS